MKQAPLFQRKFFVQNSAGLAHLEQAKGAAEYLRVHGDPSNPARTLDGRRVKLARGGMIDVVADARGGVGLGRISYGTGLRAGVKRGDDQFTYRFEVPPAAEGGAHFEVAVWGSAEQPAFRFTIEVQG
jgi:hypothetical protein